jgi:hypothetical protein
MKNLNKENFWDEMELKYPVAMHVFKGWIDQYKKEVNWDRLFRERYLDEMCGIDAPAPEFHNIPFDMQIGILMRFSSEIFHGSKPVMKPEDIMPMVKDTMEKLDISANMRTQFRSEN